MYRNHWYWKRKKKKMYGVFLLLINQVVRYMRLNHHLNIDHRVRVIREKGHLPPVIQCHLPPVIQCHLLPVIQCHLLPVILGLNLLCTVHRLPIPDFKNHILMSRRCMIILHNHLKNHMLIILLYTGYHLPILGFKSHIPMSRPYIIQMYHYPAQCIVHHPLNKHHPHPNNL